MTPFGQRIRELREQRGIMLKAMAAELGVSSAYLSALEHGHRGRPGSGLVMQICGYFGLIWDDVEELKRLAILSHPRVVIDTAGLSPQANFSRRCSLKNKLRKVGVLGELAHSAADHFRINDHGFAAAFGGGETDLLDQFFEHRLQPAGADVLYPLIYLGG